MTVIAAWQDLLAPTMRPTTSVPALVLDGFLTGVIVAPRPIPLHRWLAALWRDEDLTLWDAGRATAERDAIVLRQTALAAEIDRHLARLETERVCDYRPAFMVGDDKPAHATIRRWAGGFYTAMALVPDAWTALLEDSRTEVLVAPFVGFFGVEDAEPFETAEDVDQRLDDHAAFIPPCHSDPAQACHHAKRAKSRCVCTTVLGQGRPQQLVPVRLRHQVQALLR